MGYSRKALVLWTSSQDGWKGEVLGGQDVPFKIVFVDGANRGRPQGVTPIENVAFLCDITGETQQGTRKGVLFARPLRQASFGWVPVGEPCMGVRRQEWQCTDMPGVSVSSRLAPPPKDEPDDNRLYKEAIRLLEQFKSAYLPEVFCTFGWPDDVLPSPDGKNIRLVWQEIGERTVPSSQLAGLCKRSRPKGVEELYVSWRDACRPWPVEFIEGSLSPLPQERGNFRVTARYRFCHFSNLEFETAVIDAYGEYIAWGFLAGGLPQKERRQIQVHLASLAPTPQESAREYVLARTDQLRLSARVLACWQAPGKVLFDLVSRQESRTSPESEDGYRPAVSYTVAVTYARLRWYLPPEESCPSMFSDYGGHSELFPNGTTEESAREMNSRRLEEEYVRYRKELSDLRTEIPFGSYAAFLDPDAQARWAAEYAQTVTRLVGETLAEVEALRAQIVAERSEVMLQWEEAHALVEQAEQEAREAVTSWQDVMGYNESPPPRPIRDGSGPQGEKAFGQAMLAWVADIRTRVEEVAAERHLAVVSAKQAAQLEADAPSAPWYLFGFDSDGVTRVAGIVGRKPGEGIGLKRAAKPGWTPGDAPLVAIRVSRDGGRRHEVEIASCQGVEVIYDYFDSRTCAGYLVWIARIIDPAAWRVEWQQFKDRKLYGSLCWADRKGVHPWGDREIVPWEVLSKGGES